MDLKKRLVRAYRSIEHYVNRPESSCGVLAENFYLIQKAYRETCRARGMNGRVFSECARYLGRNGNVCEKQSFFAFFEGADLSFSEIYNIPAFLNAALIISAGEEAALLDSGRRCDMQKLTSSVISLHRVREIRCEECFEKLCGAENVLRSGAELYAQNDKRSKDMCREAVIRYARRRKMSETEAARELCARKGGLYAAAYGKTHKAAFFISLFALFALFAGVTFYAFGFFAVFALPPLFLLSGTLCDRVFSRVVPPFAPLRLESDCAAASARTVVVYSTLLFGAEKDFAVFDELENAYLRNRGPCAVFGVLGDFADSESETAPGDAAVAAYAQKRISELNAAYGDRFALFLRGRSYNSADKIWQGGERKRGAVCDLVKFITEGEDVFAYSQNASVARGAKYLLTLDSDTVIPLGAVRELVSTALHPANRPRIKDGRVTSGHAVFQPRMKTGLLQSFGTYFTLMRAEFGSLYDTASYERYQSLFGSGIFCGKGLIDVAAFAAVAEGAFPKGKILSHDIPEGAILRCMFVPDITFSDSNPKSPLSAFLRLHRWVRGDIQNLCLLGSRRIPASGRFVLCENALRQLSPVFAASGVPAYAFFTNSSQHKAAVFALVLLANTLAPAAFSFVSVFFGRAFTPRRFFSVMFSSAKLIAFNLAYELSALFEYAFRSADAALRAVWRTLVSHRKTLEWTTFSQTEARSGGVAVHITAFFFSSAVGAALVFFSPHFVFRLLGAAAFLLPVVSYAVSRPVKSREKRIDEKTKEKLLSYAREQYAFFAERVTQKTNFLPPDNVQFSPAEAVAERTSPTNIGLYLLCVAAADDMGFIPREKAVCDIEKTLITLEKMEKYRGHLYNWYDTRSLDVIGERYVSTVDSGNLAVSLITLAAALRSFGEEGSALAARAEKLARDMDMAFLYDNERELFYIGYSEQNGFSPHRYDMLMSEIRTACYWTCAYGITPGSHWNALSRAVTEKNGFVGMISWSGSAFEYFMPQLFLPSYPNSFLDETLSFAAYCQHNFRKEKLWGTSESGYYCFDADMNYQYKAHGVPALALKEYTGTERVFSPYSAFLMLERMPESVMRLLGVYEKLGARGEYGFYEAVDLSERGGIVRSYMAHHVAMSMLAIDNACFDGIMRRRFFRDKQIAACRELLCERIPADVRLCRGRKPFSKRERPYFAADADRVFCETARPECALYKKGNLSMAASSDGRVALRCGAYAVDRTEFKAFSPVSGVTFGAVKDGRAFCCSPFTGTPFASRFGKDSFAFVSSDTRCPLSVKGHITSPGGAFVFDLRAESALAGKLCMHFTPVLDKPSAYSSHPAFSRLFITSSFLKNEKILIFRRRSEPGGGRYPYIGVACGDVKASMEFGVCASRIRSHSRGGMNSAFLNECSGDTDVCGDPDCTVRVSPSARGSARFIIACGYTLREVTNSVAGARKAQAPAVRGTRGDGLASAAVSACLFERGTDEKPSAGMSCLWKAGVSGDCPLLVLEVYGKNPAPVKAFLGAYRSLAGAYYKSELLFLIHERPGYDSPLAQWIKELVSAEGLDRYCGRKYGVFAANSSVFDENELRFIRSFSAFTFESDSVFRSSPGYSGAGPRVQRGSESPLGEKIAPPSVFVSGTPPLPRSYVMSGFALGTLVTEKTLGFTFYGSARDGRISCFDQDPHAPVYGEELLMKRGGNLYDLVSLSASAEYRDGIARYTGNICGVGYTVKAFVHPRLPVKIIEAEFENENVDTVFYVTPQEKKFGAYVPGIRNAGFFVPVKHGPGMTCFVACDTKCELFTDRTLALAGESTGSCDSVCIAANAQRVAFFLGACPTETGAASVVSYLRSGDTGGFAKEACEFARSFIPPQTAFTQNGVTDSLYAYFAPYQAAFSRFLGRTGFYQTGGAYGFRDQLQDCLCLVYSRPDLVRSHIIRCAAHQYMRGDVMHWWLKTERFTGTRTACSDDMLYLPLTVADYVEKTGDETVLEVKIPYLSSPPVERGERFEKAERTPERESVYMHCLRALLYCAGRTGAHGLSLMGSCDWNDGFSAVGREGRGESVFTTFLLAYVSREFARVCELVGDAKSASVLRSVYGRAAEAGRNSFKGDRFPRGTFDDGSFFGVKESRECAIDVISQAFAAAVLGKTPETTGAVNAAYRELYDEEKNIFKLFSPPFETIDAGYVSAYPPGIRENGGQYTHGALWGIWGLAVCGEYEKAVRLINAVTPAGHTDAEKYMLEPYVIPADIYSSGRGGWSWYTGSAAWFYKIMTEVIMGIRFSCGFTKILVSPVCEYTFVCERGGCKLKIISSRAAGETPELDGVPCAFPLALPPGEHVLRVKAPY